MLIFWSLVRNSVVLAVYLLFSVACFLTVHEHPCSSWLKKAGLLGLRGVISSKGRIFLTKSKFKQFLAISGTLLMISPSAGVAIFVSSCYFSKVFYC